MWMGIAVAILVIGLFIQKLTPHLLPSIFTTIARPFWRIEFSLQSGSLRSPEALLNENEDLKRQLADISVRMQSTTILEQENSDLKAILGRSSDVSASTTISTTTPITASAITSPITSKTTTGSRTKQPNVVPILSAILVRPPLAPYDELVIDIGADYGVSVGDNVYAPGNVIIGHIVDVLSNTSKVELLSSPSSSFEVEIGAQAIPATAHGRGGGQYSADLSHDTTVQAGDLVIVPSIDHKIVGIVGAVNTDPAHPFSTILFAPPANMFSMRWVIVGTSVVTAH